MSVPRNPNPLVILFDSTGIDFNVTTDNAMPIRVKAASYAITQIRVYNSTRQLATAAGGIYTAATKGGTAVVAAAQTYATITGANQGMFLTLSPAGNQNLTAQTLYLNLTTAEGAAATGAVRISGFVLS